MTPSHSFFRRKTVARFAAAVAGLLIAGAHQACAQSPQVLALGKAEFEFHCVVCHGSEGRGDGEMSKVLVKPPTNLTQLTQTNDGRFPFWQVYAIIGGAASVIGHQPFEMPGFWKRFHAEEKRDSLLSAEMRILVLTHYIESLQE